MTVARSAADVLSSHVRFQVECIDRMYLNVYQPKLQYAAGLVGYVHRQLGLPIASTAPLARITDRFVTAVHRFADTEGIPWIDFVKGQRKDDVMHQQLAMFTASEGVVFIGRAQEKTPLFRTEKRRHADGVAYPWIVKTTGVVNHFYFYCVDSRFRPVLSSSSAPTSRTTRSCASTATTGRSGRPRRPGWGSYRWTTRSPRSTTRSRCSRSATGWARTQIRALLDKWLAILPNPFTDADDHLAGYDYDVSMLQMEFSLTQRLDTPTSGRVFFEQVIRDNLDIGRPDQVGLIFDRRIFRKGPRATPGRFRTRVITDGVTASLHADYKHTTIKQYHKEGKAPTHRDHR